MRAELRKRNDRYFLVLEDGILYNGDLSLKNCQAIERGYDLDELIEEVYPTPIFGLSIERKRERASFKSGFQKALEILGDKKFTEEDMAREIHLWDCHINVHEEDKGCLREIYKRVKSLQQNEWEVEIIIECTQCQSYGYVSECRDNCNKKFLQPKLDADGCLKLKRV